MVVLEMKWRVEEEWLIFEDKCSKFFHRLQKAKKNKFVICEIEDILGAIYTDKSEVTIVGVNNFFEELGTDKRTELNEGILENIDSIKAMCSQQVEDIARPISNKEIQSVFHCMEPNKSLGPDELNGFFFKDN